MKKNNGSSIKINFTRLIRGLFCSLLGSFAFLLTGCYAPYDPNMAVPYKITKGAVCYKEDEKPVENNTVELVFTVSGEQNILNK